MSRPGRPRPADSGGHTGECVAYSVLSIASTRTCRWAHYRWSSRRRRERAYSVLSIASTHTCRWAHYRWSSRRRRARGLKCAVYISAHTCRWAHYRQSSLRRRAAPAGPVSPPWRSSWCPDSWSWAGSSSHPPERVGKMVIIVFINFDMMQIPPKKI